MIKTRIEKCGLIGKYLSSTIKMIFHWADNDTNENSGHCPIQQR